MKLSTVFTLQDLIQFKQAVDGEIILSNKLCQRLVQYYFKSGHSYTTNEVSPGCLYGILITKLEEEELK